MISSLSTLLRERKNVALATVKFGAVKFFQPNEEFWEVIQPFQKHYLIDAGAGMGHVTEEGTKRGFMMTAIDVASREDQSALVIVGADATVFPYTDKVWPLICRPDHDGWCYEVIEHALKQGASVLYVGLTKNADRDLGKYNRPRYKTRFSAVVGRDGEKVYIISTPTLKGVT